MTDHYFEHPLVKLHYYKFGTGNKVMLCFHGFGMHGKQFKQLAATLGDQYTFYGFDLFFHKETILKNNNISYIKSGISKQELANIFVDFCRAQTIQKFSLISYSMGSHYAATLVEEVPIMVEEFITAAPATLKPGWLVTFLSRNKLGNKLLEKLALSKNGLVNLLALVKKLKIVDHKIHEILYREIETYQLRFNLYACFTFLKHLKLDQTKFIACLNKHQINSIFIFGIRDHNYPPEIGSGIISEIKLAKEYILDSNHEMINQGFAIKLKEIIHDHKK